MPAEWIDFRALKAQIPILDVLARYNFLAGLREKGPEKLVGPCPVHGGKNPNSFHVNTKKNVYNCFSSCGGGNILDLVMKVEQCEIREAGRKLAEWFNVRFDGARPPAIAAAKPASAEAQSAAPAQVPTRPTAAVNPPLDHELKRLDQKHAYLIERGVSPETVKTFGVGFCSRGIMKGRIAIPIHNERGKLVAYAGRAIDAELAKEGKYKLPAGFLKGHVVHNLHRAKERASAGLIVVEGFFDAMKVHQAGFPNVVALMGSSMTQEQEELLVAATDRLTLMFDGDEAGVAGLRKVYGHLRRRMFLREVHLEAAEQPDSIPDGRLRDLLAATRDR
jgi:DNA primase